ncbi:complex I NDUFA9 subunit family protein [Bradyrhizobium sp. STM 3562]|uniref:complex I NDUFA9 subunit family protein n=1 Tax=Bradyrhizobium sp. STM 3562 TaxID=578924 RepID=UPI0038906474
MPAATNRTIAVFGGTGFLGRRIVRHLRSSEFRVRIVSRHADQAQRSFGSDDPKLQFAQADIQHERSVADALAGAYGTVNAVSLYVEQGRMTFHSIHVDSARRVAAQARLAGVQRLVHISGIGANNRSSSRYIRMRGEGELAIRAAFADAILVRPAVMFGEDDAFVATILELLRKLPIYPMFGRGQTRLQPVDAEDVAEAITQLFLRSEVHSRLFELGGPRVYSYEELLRAVAREAGLSPMLVPIPFAAWHGLAWISEMLPRPRLARNQVELMQIDTVASPEIAGFAELGIPPHSIEETVQKLLLKRDARPGQIA